jgi:hypothetical protein
LVGKTIGEWVLDGSEDLDKMSHIHPWLDLQHSTGRSTRRQPRAIAFPVPFRIPLPPGKTYMQQQ